MRTYSELNKYNTFIERYRYLKIGGVVGEDTFGFDRWINQVLYHSKEWLSARVEVMLRDSGCDLGCYDRQIYERPVIHHMNPITREDILHRNPIVFDPEYLITCSHATHNAIHYGDESMLETVEIVERKPNDTCPWKQ